MRNLLDYVIIFSFVAVGSFLGIFCSEIILWGLGRKNTLIAEWLGEHPDHEGAQGPPRSYYEAVSRMCGVNEEMVGPSRTPCASSRGLQAEQFAALTKHLKISPDNTKFPRSQPNAPLRDCESGRHERQGNGDID